jgi:acetyl-CoA synthetase
MFRGYLHDDERYAEAFADGWYLSGDVARRDADGYYWFVARADDVIKSAGHLIGPFEVESVLLEHPAAAEAGVIGKPDPLAGELVKGFVPLKDKYEPSEALRTELIAFGRRKLGAVAPKGTSTSISTCRTPRAARSCAGSSRPRNLGWRQGTSRPWENGHEPGCHEDGSVSRRAPPQPAGPDDADPALRRKVHRDVQRQCNRRQRPGSPS